MAKILYEVKQNKNEHNAAFGKWYAQIKSLETLNKSEEDSLTPDPSSTDEGSENQGGDNGGNSGGSAGFETGN